MGVTKQPCTQMQELDESPSSCWGPRGRVDVVVLALGSAHLDFHRCDACLSWGWCFWSCCGVMCWQPVSDSWLLPHTSEGSVSVCLGRACHLWLTNVVVAALSCSAPALGGMVQP